MVHTPTEGLISLRFGSSFRPLARVIPSERVALLSAAFRGREGAGGRRTERRGAMAAAGRFCLLAVLVVLVAVHAAPAAAGGLRGLHFHDTRFSVPQSRVAELAEYWPLRGLAKYYDKDNWEGLVDPRAFEDQTYMPAVANATECKECIGKVRGVSDRAPRAATLARTPPRPAPLTRAPRVCAIVSDPSRWYRPTHSAFRAPRRSSTSRARRSRPRISSATRICHRVTSPGSREASASRSSATSWTRTRRRPWRSSG